MTKIDKPELKTLDYKLEQPTACGCAHPPEQPNSNAMIFERVNGSIEVVLERLGQLKPKTVHVDVCMEILKSWQDNNLNHLQKAFE
jgi:hypothetical protein